MATAEEYEAAAEAYAQRCLEADYTTSRRRSQERHARGAERERVVLVNGFFWGALIAVAVLLAIYNW